MEFDEILDWLNGALDVVKQAEPIGTALGVPGVVFNVAGLASTAIAVAENVKQRIDDGAIVATGEDTAEIEKIIGELQAANDDLAAKIAAS